MECYSAFYINLVNAFIFHIFLYHFCFLVTLWKHFLCLLNKNQIYITFSKYWHSCLMVLWGKKIWTMLGTLLGSLDMWSPLFLDSSLFPKIVVAYLIKLFVNIPNTSKSWFLERASELLICVLIMEWTLAAAAAASFFFFFLIL